MDINFILSSIGVFLVIILVLVIILLVAKKYLSPSGNVTMTINGDNKLSVEQGSSVLATLSANHLIVFVALAIDNRNRYNRKLIRISIALVCTDGETTRWSELRH